MKALLIFCIPYHLLFFLNVITIQLSTRFICELAATEYAVYLLVFVHICV